VLTLTTRGWQWLPLTYLVSKQDLIGGGTTTVDFLQKEGDQAPGEDTNGGVAIGLIVICFEMVGQHVPRGQLSNTGTLKGDARHGDIGVTTH